ncbi:TPR-like protein [Rhizophagus irregularis]|uniref:TPR-like protein n=1 Tax=Rhizophagus irregularis TaxID=588596 RepID=A0A2I1FX47_9GLOM|nr:TPR-like protein [Rhizophagus irregularis]
MSKIEEIQESVNNQENEEIIEETPKFTPKEIAELLETAEQHKSTGNKFFSLKKFDEAIEQYKKALDTCPIEKKKERAVYWGNIGACEVKLNRHKEAVDACTKALEDDPAYTKVLFRRAQANEKVNTLFSTNSALEDYKKLSSDPIHKSDRVVLDNHSLISNAIKRLPPKIKELEEKEKAEMIDKLKGFGNTILGKFGLSTDNFKIVQDEKGSCNIQFVNNPDKNGEGGS